MQFTPTHLPEVVLVTPQLFGDQRGFFLEMYHADKFRDAGLNVTFVQDNLSRSQQHVLRGLHYQIRHPQGKLVTVLSGAIFDVAVDVRRSSPTFGHWVGQLLDAERREALFVPAGFAHGFLVLSETADVCYKCTDVYHPEFERSLLWNDPAIGIEWPLTIAPKLSVKDQAGLPIAQIECFP